MEMAGKFCVMCGAEDVPLIDRMCPSCYIKNRSVVMFPKFLRVEVCRVCGARKEYGRWVTPSPDSDPVTEAAEEALMNSLKLDHNINDYRVEIGTQRSDKFGVRLPVRVEGTVLGKKFNLYQEVPLKVDYVLCDSCIKRRGKYYEAIVQLRGRDGVMSWDVRRFFESFFSKDEMSNLSDVVEGKEGVDYYFISKTVAKRLVTKVMSEVRVEVKESYQNERIKRGKRDAKLVISLRL